MPSFPDNFPVREVRCTEQKEFNGKPFPLILSPQSKHQLQSNDDLVQWLKENNDVFDNLLLKSGAILFRDFPIDCPTAFDHFVKSFGLDPLPYVGGAAPRRVIVGNVFTANESPPDQPIPFHHEMAQVPIYPKVLFFYCDVPPSEGGQTPLVISNEIYRAMKERYPEFVHDLEEKGVKYTRVLPDGDDPTSPIGRGWQSTFGTTDKVEAEEKCRAQGTSFEWLPGGCLKTVTAVLPAIREDTRTGNKTWFNSVIAAYTGWKDCRNDPETAILFGDGEKMPADVMKNLTAMLDKLSVDITWQKGDVFMVDNRQVLHARRPFTPPRTILAALCK
ncbi:hypothetical protein LOTGIDRAFT_196958 [Lottia gigantea]|uniref:TauD/TfdA-like domain-containing protein n=1 Tax=Lottia gigantea TaxID=225164 RepID=V3ZHQ2_LOTGI|nr:hypothetical protein LOTGIDRAFT_196958 [Lottia gigantea]ESO83742.1 hypothetical protein LOTGIDRAFT_196958 [Lottia gigantea]